MQCCLGQDPETEAYLIGKPCGETCIYESSCCLDAATSKAGEVCGEKCIDRTTQVRAAALPQAAPKASHYARLVGLESHTPAHITASTACAPAVLQDVTRERQVVRGKPNMQRGWRNVR